MSCPPTQTMALALCRHLEKAYSLSPQIKWPNDVLLSGRKVAGILVETMGNFFVVGMGLNLVLGGAIKELRSPAAGLSDYIGRKAEAGVELRGILDELLHLIRQPASIRELKCRLACMNRNVSVLVGHPSKKDVRHGRIAGLNEDGALLLDRGNGDFFPVYSGEVDFS